MNLNSPVQYANNQPRSKKPSSDSLRLPIKDITESIKAQRTQLDGQLVHEQDDAVASVATQWPARMTTRALRKRKAGTSDGDDSEETKAWTEANVKKLMQMLQTEGFDGNYQALTKTFKSHSDSSLRYFFGHLLKTVDDDDEKKTIEAAFDKWILAARVNNETQRLGGNIPLMMRFMAQFEDHPSVESCGGVDYREIYQCIASLLQGTLTITPTISFFTHALNLMYTWASSSVWTGGRVPWWPSGQRCKLASVETRVRFQPESKLFPYIVHHFEFNLK